MMSTGFLYCFSNPCMPGLLKIGYTERPLEERIQEANVSNTWIPTPFEVELAKQVKEPVHKEQTVHKILDKYRVNPKREFFRVSMDEVRPLFDLMDGTIWDPSAVNDIDVRVPGDEVLRLFLNKHIFPPETLQEPVTYAEITSRFITWKRLEGYTTGAATKLRELLIETYGKPTRGEGWTTFSMRIPA
jgi:hypothetical protein